MITYYLMKLISKAVCIFPKPLKRLTGAFIGNVAWLVIPKWRKNLAVNQVKECLGVKVPEAKIIAKDSVLKYGHMVTEVMEFPLLNKSNIHEKVLLNDNGVLAELTKDGKGFIVATAHFGNWEMCGAGLAFYDYPIVAVAQKQHNLAMDRFINEYRTMVGQHVTYRTGVLEMARMLDEGYAIGLLCDQDAGKDGVVVNLFGKPTSCPKGPAALSRLKGVPIVLVLLNLQPDGSHILNIYPPVQVEKTKDREQDIKEATQFLMNRMEEEIKKQPEMWFWLHNRWKVPREMHKEILPDD